MTAAASGYLGLLALKHNGNVQAMANEAELNRTHMYKLLDRYGVLVAKAAKERRTWRSKRQRNTGNERWKALGEARAN